MTSTGPPATTRPVCVLGMHRSGTSLTARLANLLGLHLGPDELFLRPSFGDNPLGFWEIEAMNELNDELLAAWDGSWSAPPDLPAGWEHDARLDSLRERATELLARIAGDHPLWGFKDPRLCLTLAFWRTLVPELAHIVCVRNPLDVAASLRARNDVEESRTFALWERYMADAVASTAGEPRLILRYDDFFEDPDGQLLRLAGFLGRPPLEPGSPAKEAALGFINGALRHHRSTVEDARGEQSLSTAAKGLFAALDGWARTARTDGGDPAPAPVRESSEAAPLKRPADGGPEPAPVLYLAPWVDYGGTAKGTVDWFKWIDRERFPPSLMTTQAPSLNRLLGAVVPLAEEVWALPDILPGQAMPDFILDFIHSRGIRVVHVMNSRLGFELLPDICCLPDPPQVVVQLHVEENTRAGYVRYVTTRYANLVDAFSVTSRHLADTIVREYDVSPAKCHVIYTGVDAEEEFSPQLVTPRAGLEDGVTHILYIGRLVPQKDPGLMLDVIEALRSRANGFLVHVVGYGPMEDELKAEVARRDLADVVLLHGPTANPAEWYAACDLMLMTSIFEGIPYVVFEAMAMALPTVAPALVGMVELMQRGAGRLIDPRDDVEAYVEALAGLIGDPSERERLGAEGREIVRERFSLARMGREHDELYTRLLGGRESKERPGMVV